MKIYIIASGDYLQEVEDEVNELISKGYYPIGSLQISTSSSMNDNDYSYEKLIVQAMMLKKEHQKEIDIKWEKETK